jgi:hypothetical protein
MMKEGLEHIVGEVLGSEIYHGLLRVLWDSSGSLNSSSKPKCSAISGAFGHGLFRVEREYAARVRKQQLSNEALVLI